MGRAATGWFFGVMGLASILSLLRGFALAALLSPAAFGGYAVVVALGAFSAIVLSAGQVEATMKSFPRLWSEQKTGSVLSLSDRIAVRLALRAAGAVAIVLPLAWVLGYGNASGKIVAVGTLALSTSLTSLYMSAHRASLDLASMAPVTLQRAALALAMGCIGGWILSWPGAVAGEFCGAVLGSYLSRRKAMQLSVLSRSDHSAAPAAAHQHGKKRHDGGIWFFAAAVTAAIPAYLDRVFVAHQWSLTDAGRYGFLLLFVTGANVFAGIVAQKVGPQLIRMAHLGDRVGSQIRLVCRWIAVNVALYLFGMVLVGCLLLMGDITGLGRKYGIALADITVVAALCAMQVMILIEWLLISRDNEKQVYLATALHLVVVLFICIVTTWNHLSLVEFMWSLVAAKIVQGFGLAVFVGRLRAPAGASIT